MFMLVFECVQLVLMGDLGVFEQSVFFPLFIYLYTEESSSVEELSKTGFSHIDVLGNQTSLHSTFIM